MCLPKLKIGRFDFYDVVFGCQKSSRIAPKKKKFKKSWESYNNFFKKTKNIYIKFKLIENTIFLIFYKLKFFVIFKYLFIISLVMLTSNVTLHTA